MRSTKGSSTKGCAFLLTLGLLSGTLTGCANTTTSQSGEQATGDLQVVAAFYPLYYIASEIVGDLGEVTNATQAGGEAHDLELSLSQVQEISDADLVLYLGSGFQTSMEQAVSSTGVTALDAMDVVPTERVRTDDPHIWLDPGLMADIAAAFGAKLAEVSPENATQIQERTETVESALRELDQEFANTLADLSGATMVVTHEAFGYLTDAYGLEQLGIRGVNPEEEPSTARLLSVAESAQASGATTLFYDADEDTSTVQNYADLLELEISPILTLETEPTKNGQNLDYLSAMRENLSELQQHLVAG